MEVDKLQRLKVMSVLVQDVEHAAHSKGPLEGDLLLVNVARVDANEEVALNDEIWVEVEDAAVELRSV